MIDNRKELIAEFVWRAFRDAGAIIENGHFVYSSGRHGSVYVDHHAIYTNLNAVSKMCRFMDENIFSLPDFPEIEVVIGPEGGGILLSCFLASELQDDGKLILPLWAKKQWRNNGEKYFSFPQSFQEKLFRKNIFLVDDVVTTGGTFREIIALASIFGGNVIGCGCLWNRGGTISADLGGIPLFSLFEKKLEDWPPADCPLCKAGIPINTKFGHPNKN